MITDQQVKLLRSNMSKYTNQKIAAAKSGMSESSARKYLKTQSLPSEMKKSRHWRTRINAFESVWEKIEQLLTLSPRLTDVATLKWTHRLKSTSHQLGASNDKKKSNPLPQRV